MHGSGVLADAETWNLPLPAELIQAFDKLSAEDEIGVWKLNPLLLDPKALDSGGPIDLL